MSQKSCQCHAHLSIADTAPGPEHFGKDCRDVSANHPHYSIGRQRKAIRWPWMARTPDSVRSFFGTITSKRIKIASHFVSDLDNPALSGLHG